MTTLAEADQDSIREVLREYYGRQLSSKADLTEKTCCTTATQARYAPILRQLPDEVVTRHYGCGCPVPQDDLRGLVCLDLGSGAGVDAFILSALVGPEGHVHGIDMTDEQLTVAREAAPVVAERFGYSAPNTTFHRGFIETADDIESDSVDLVISDCVVNLSPRKDLVLETIWRVLKEGGELYISDIVSDRRLPAEISEDERLIAECIGGAMYEYDFLDLVRRAGFVDPRIVERDVLQTDVKGFPNVLTSITVRAQKFSKPLESRCEDYGQLATYLGTFESCPARFVYDDHHVFERGRPTPVCGNTARMLSETRLKSGFQVTQPQAHLGLFGAAQDVPVGAPIPVNPPAPAKKGCC